MKVILSLITFSLILGFTACTDKTYIEEPASVNTTMDVNFKLAYDGQPLVYLDEYAYGAAKIKFSKVNFYLTNISLTKADGTDVPIKDVIYVDFSDLNNSLAGAEAGATFTLSDVPSGQYIGLKCGIGLDSILNSKHPSDYPSTNPLSQSFNYWDAWNSYIFSKLEGRVDYNNDGTFESSFAYHTGLTELYKPISYSRQFKVGRTSAESQNLPNRFTIDIKEILFNEIGEPVNVAVHPSSHNPNEVHFADYIITQFSKALKLL